MSCPRKASIATGCPPSICMVVISIYVLASKGRTTLLLQELPVTGPNEQSRERKKEDSIVIAQYVKVGQRESIGYGR